MCPQQPAWQAPQASRVGLWHAQPAAPCLHSQCKSPATALTCSMDSLCPTMVSSVSDACLPAVPETEPGRRLGAWHQTQGGSPCSRLSRCKAPHRLSCTSSHYPSPSLLRDKHLRFKSCIPHVSLSQSVEESGQCYTVFHADILLQGLTLLQDLKTSGLAANNLVLKPFIDRVQSPPHCRQARLAPVRQ